MVTHDGLISHFPDDIEPEALFKTFCDPILSSIFWSLWIHLLFASLFIICMNFLCIWTELLVFSFQLSSLFLFPFLFLTPFFPSHHSGWLLILLINNNIKLQGYTAYQCFFYRFCVYMCVCVLFKKSSLTPLHKFISVSYPR